MNNKTKFAWAWYVLSVGLFVTGCAVDSGPLVMSSVLPCIIWGVMLLEGSRDE
jgi:hypothetical protein